LAGLSMGGYVTFAMFRQAPERFTRMILADTKSQADSPQAREGRAMMRERLAKDGRGAWPMRCCRSCSRRPHGATRRTSSAP